MDVLRAILGSLKRLSPQAESLPPSRSRTKHARSASLAGRNGDSSLRGTGLAEYDENDINPLFTGKRGAERVAADRAIEMKGRKITVGARTVDLSPSGFRARLSPQALGKLGGGRDAGKLMAAVHRHFASGLDVRFVESGVAIKAHVVRLAFEPGPTTEVHIACRFSADLAKSDWKKIEPKDKS